MVNVYYVTAPGTLDDVVWGVLERKLAVLEALDYTKRGAEGAETGRVNEEVLERLLRDFEVPLDPTSEAGGTDS